MSVATNLKLVPFTLRVSKVSEVLPKVLKSSIRLAKVAELLSVSSRQALRLWRRFPVDRAAAGGTGCETGFESAF